MGGGDSSISSPASRTNGSEELHVTHEPQFEHMIYVYMYIASSSRIISE
jgi:hypothetical protein